MRDDMIYIDYLRRDGLIDRFAYPSILGHTLRFELKLSSDCVYVYRVGDDISTAGYIPFKYNWKLRSGFNPLDLGPVLSGCNDSIGARQFLKSIIGIDIRRLVEAYGVYGGYQSIGCSIDGWIAQFMCAVKDMVGCGDKLPAWW